jgi:TolB-like protein
LSLFNELKRRNVFRVCLAYLLFAWVFLQGADFVLDMIGAPAWVIQALTLLAAMGLPGLLIFSWVYEMTPEGLKRESEIDRDTSITAHTGRKLDRAIIVLLALGLIYFAWESRFAERTPVQSQPSAVPTTTSPAKSVAVLPFADLSRNQDQGWFADGLAEEILNALAKTPDLLVSSRTSSFKYKGNDLDVSQIAAELGVAHVLEGSVRSGGDRIRVTAQLIRASDGFHVWSENYDRDLADMISIQEDLARNIARALETTMDPAALAEMSSAGTRSVAAYEEYLRGVDLDVQAWQTAEGFEERREAYRHFERAREIDPGFAKAHFRAADFWKTHLDPTRTDFGETGLTPVERQKEFDVRIERAIETAPNETEKKLYLATRATVDLRLNDAVELLLEYLDERPNDGLAQSELFTAAQMSSQHDLLEPMFEQLAERAMTDTYAASSFTSSAWRVLDPRLAVPDVLRIADRWPDAAGVMYQVHRSLLWAERYDEADRIAARFRSLTGEPNPIFDARLACVAGDRDQAEAILARLDVSRGNEISLIWHILMLLGRERAAADLLMPLDASGVPFQLASWLVYPQFDASHFPNLQRVLRREGIERAEPAEIPFKCPPPTEPSIAVLPFRDMSAARDQAYFGEGIAEELLNALVKLEGIKVASRTSTFSLADDDLDIPAIAERLGVNHILEGSVRTSGNQVRVTAQLIDVSEDAHVWSETYDGMLDDIFKIQDEITAKISAAMRVQLGGVPLASAAEELTTNAEAYQLYLQGRHLWRQRNSEALHRAVDLFSRAVELDPGFHQAWSNLGVAYLNLSDYDRSYDIDESFAKGLAAADRALALDPASTEARLVKANYSQMQCDMEGAAEQFLAAIQDDPGDPTARHWYALILLSAGRIELAQQHIDAAVEVDPLISALIAISAYARGLLGQSEESLELARQASALGFRGGASEIEAYMLLISGKREAGAQKIRNVAASEGSQRRRELFERFAQALENPAARGPFESFVGNASNTHRFDATEVSDLLELLGSDHLFDYYAGEDCPIMGQLIWSPSFREQRGTPEFYDLMRRAGYVDFWRKFGWPDDCASLDQSLAECPP